MDLQVLFPKAGSDLLYEERFHVKAKREREVMILQTEALSSVTVVSHGGLYSTGHSTLYLLDFFTGEAGTATVGKVTRTSPPPLLVPNATSSFNS